MSTTTKSIVFLVLAFAITWAITIAGHFSGLKDSLGAMGPTAILAASMAGPAIAALICVFAFEKGRRVKALGLGGRWSVWWFLAWLIPLLLTGAALALTLALGDRTYVDIGQAQREALEASGQDVSQVPAFLLDAGVLIGLAAIFGALINWPILTFTEELGWRGYLYDLWRPSGFWRVAIATGVIWGTWHAPAIYFYGLNYPTQPLLGMALFIVPCVFLSIILTHVRDRTNSVWAAGLFHGTFNAVGGLSIAMASNPEFPWNGIVGIGGLIAMAVGAGVIALLRMRNVEAEPAVVAT